MSEYTTLFNAITDELEQLDAIRALLVRAQQDAEDIVISRDDA